MTTEPIPVVSPETAAPEDGCAVVGNTWHGNATRQILGSICPVALPPITAKF